MNGIYIVNIHKFNSTSLNTKNIFIMKFKKIISKENSKSVVRFTFHSFTGYSSKISSTANNHDKKYYFSKDFIFKIISILELQ